MVHHVAASRLRISRGGSCGQTSRQGAVGDSSEHDRGSEVEEPVLRGEERVVVGFFFIYEWGPPNSLQDLKFKHMRCRL